MHYLGKKEADAVRTVIESGVLMRYRGGEGGFTEQFEEDIAATVGVKHALTVNSGTNALIAALVGMGIGPGDEVIVPGYTFIATALAPLAVGAVPIMAEINETLTIDPEDIKRKITPYTKVIIPVHILNNPCEMDAIMAIAKENDLAVLEDACQAVGGSYRGKRLGSIGDAGVFSFNLYKNITCGEGGAILTDDDSIYERALIYHDGGAYDRQYAKDIDIPFFPGVNMRVSEIQGAMLGEQLKIMDGFLDGLRERRRIVVEKLKKSTSFKITPHYDEGSAPSISILFETSDQAEKFCAKHKRSQLINTGRHVYTNWTPIMSQNVQNEKLNPYKMANREIKYSKDMCPATLDILSRTVQIAFAYDAPLSDVETMADGLLG